MTITSLVTWKVIILFYFPFFVACCKPKFSNQIHNYNVHPCDNLNATKCHLFRSTKFNVVKLFYKAQVDLCSMLWTCNDFSYNFICLRCIPCLIFISYVNVKILQFINGALNTMTLTPPPPPPLEIFKHFDSFTSRS
jgi:hypothetical protein